MGNSGRGVQQTGWLPCRVHQLRKMAIPNNPGITIRHTIHCNSLLVTVVPPGVQAPPGLLSIVRVPPSSRNDILTTILSVRSERACASIMPHQILSLYTFHFSIQFVPKNIGDLPLGTEALSLCSPPNYDDVRQALTAINIADARTGMRENRVEDCIAHQSQQPGVRAAVFE